MDKIVEFLNSMRRQLKVEEMGNLVCKQLSFKGALLIMVDGRIERTLKISDLTNEEGKISFVPLTEILEKHPGSNVRFTVIDSDKIIVASYGGHIKNTPR